jgi:2-polyprenyl-3-methyl-5-hydroxy-6-metoxy-1,4-benzoquinol methylase
MITAEVPPRGATDALVERLNAATLGTLELASVHIGNRLGFYRALAEGGDATPGELAARTGTAERYVREWLEQQAVAGFLTAHDPDAPAEARRDGLPAAHRPVFVEEESMSHIAPLATLAIGVLGPMNAVLDAYRTGAGVPYEAYGTDTREGIAAINRPGFVNQLAGWLACIPEVDARLRAQPPARVADLACGTGWSSVAIARAYPDVNVDAIDADAESIEDARRIVAAAGLGDRVHPTIRDAGDAELGGPYDLVTIFEALHDMNHPVQALCAARAMLAEHGSVVISDERVADRFTAPGDELERSHYGWSVVHCLPVGMIDHSSAGTGAVIRPDTVRAYAAEAGFGQVKVLSIEHESWRFYRLTP